MRIAEVRATPVSIPAKQTCTWSFGRSYGHSRTIVEVMTDDGRVGLGEASLPRLATVINEELAGRLKGIDPYEISVARNACQRDHRDFGYLADSTLNMAFSAIEIALWDLIGQHRGLPLFKVLGGAVRERAPFAAYSYTVALEEGYQAADVPQIMADRAVQSIAATDAQVFEFKVGRHAVDCDIATVHAIRQAVGPTVELAVDANMAFDMDRARRFLRGTRDVLGGIEEPVATLTEMTALRREFGIPVSTHCTDLETLKGFPEIDDIVGDINVDGGISGVLRLAAAVRTRGHRFWLRSNGETGIGWAAMCHLGMACEALDRPAQTLIDWIEDDIIIGEPWLVRQGGVRPPDRPGLGIAIDIDAFRYYADYYRQKGAFTRFDKK